MEVENAMGDGRGTLTQEEPNSTIKWNVQTKMERKETEDSKGQETLSP